MKIVLLQKILLQCSKYSLIAGAIVLGIILYRIAFKNSPKWVNCALWGIIALRLLLPFSFESKMSPIPSGGVIPIKVISKSMDTAGSVEKSVMPGLTLIWIAGIVILLAYGIGSSIYLKYLLSTATLFEKGVKQSDKIESSFVFGLIRPTIYIPYDLSKEDIKQVLAHEKAHISRLDYLRKVIGYLLLCVYWFNPLIWVAYILLGRDIESACDEKVIKSLSDEDRKSYSYALLECSVKKGVVYSCPIAFGEINVKARIRDIMSYKKPKFYVFLAAALFGIVVFGISMTNQPKAKAAVQNEVVEETEVAEGTEELAEELTEAAISEENSEEEAYNASYATSKEEWESIILEWYEADQSGDNNVKKITVFGPEDGVYGPDVHVERIDADTNPDTNETEITVYLIHE